MLFVDTFYYLCGAEEVASFRVQWGGVIHRPDWARSGMCKCALNGVIIIIMCV